MTYLLDRDQDQRLQKDQKIEEIYLEGISDGADGSLPAMPELSYLEGYCEGMRQRRMQIRLAPLPEPTEVKKFPLLCAQCAHLIKGKHTIKSIDRSSSNYACDVISVDIKTAINELDEMLHDEDFTAKAKPYPSFFNCAP